ncbi:MAG TPA: hypothetical protein VLA00_18480 [Xanthobacteraceae bacterium]|nr:hypothetical protein [Xanthobacteraceae bacterium]
MNKIVREHYPVENLPEDLRVGIEGPYVRVTVVAEPETQPSPITWTEIRERLKERRLSTTTEEAVARIRALRDEWDR